MTKLILGPIIGDLAHEHVKLWGRADGEATLRAWIGKNEDGSDAIKHGSIELTVQLGFAGAILVDELKPETQYAFALSLKDKKPEKEDFHTFTTAPEPAQPRDFTFAFGSCFLPINDKVGESFAEMSKTTDIRFLLMIGDQIYADDQKHNSLNKVAVSTDEYRAVYASNFSRPPLRNLLANTPVFMTLDDHEVDDDWRWTSAARDRAKIPITNTISRWWHKRPKEEWLLSAQRVKNALQANYEHQVMHAPDRLKDPDQTSDGHYALTVDDPGSLAYTFTHGAAAFFVMDTRTARIKGKGKTMLGEKQWEQLSDWLEHVKDNFPVKFIVSSASVLHPLWIDIARDRWSGFRKERKRLLNLIAEKNVGNLHFLTGDLHSSHIISADLAWPEQAANRIWEFCSSPFEQKPNKISRFTYYPIITKPIRNARRRAWQNGNGFGTVAVRFGESGQASVEFTIHYHDQEGWKRKTVRTISDFMEQD